MQFFRIIIILFAIWPSVSAAKNAKPSTACMDAAAKAEARHGIPSKLLQAIALVETGRTEGDDFVAWPWTTNIDANGRYFTSKKEVARFVRDRLFAGETSIDVGCFQINTKWHGENFETIDRMLDPHASAEYAAKFLVELKNEFGDWQTAATKYHSRTPVYAQRYGKKLTAIQNTLLKKPDHRAGTIKPIARPTRSQPPNINAGGIALLTLVDAKPLFERRARPSLLRDVGSP